MEDTIETPPPPPPPQGPKRSQLKLSWPPCVEYSGPIIDENGNNVTACLIDNIDRWEDTCLGRAKMESHEKPTTESAKEGRFSKTRRIESSVQADIPSRTDRLVETPWTGHAEHALGTLYGHLPRPDGLRLLLLHGAESFHAPVHCSVVVTGLEDPKIPTYEALSYTWADRDGDKRNCMAIFIGPQYQVLLVTRSCQSALRSLRTRYDKVLWVDAICINQHDPLERQFQVGLMPAIYTSAARVLVYLGEERDASEKAMRLVAAHPTSDEDGREALAQLLRRPYSHRIWVIQEVAHSRKATVTCGNETIHWTSLCSASQSCKLNLTWINHFSFPKRDSQNPPELLQLLIDTRNSDCADPRDRVYGLVGLVHLDEAKLFPVDYSLPVQQVYTGLAAYWAQKSKNSPSFEFISFAQSEKKIPGLPSWVPDWSNLADRQGGAVGLRVSIDVSEISMPRSSWGFDATKLSIPKSFELISKDGFKQETDQSRGLEVWNYDKAHIARKTKTLQYCDFTYNIETPTIQLDVGSLVTAGYPLFRYLQGTLKFAGRHQTGLHIDHSKVYGHPRLLDSEQELEVFYFPRWKKSLVLKRYTDSIFSVAGSFSVDMFSSDRGLRTTPGFRTLDEASDHMSPHEINLIVSWRAAVAFLQECLFQRSGNANPQTKLSDALKHTVKRRTLATATESPITSAHLELMEQMRTEMLQSLSSAGIDISFLVERQNMFETHKYLWLTVRDEFEKSFCQALPEWTHLEGQPEDLVMSWRQDVTTLKAFVTRGSYIEAFQVCLKSESWYHVWWSFEGSSPVGLSLREGNIWIYGPEAFQEAFVHLQETSLDGSRSWNWNRDRFWICLLSFDLIARLAEFLYNRQILSLLQNTIRDGELEPVVLI